LSNQYEARISKLIKELDELRQLQALDHKLMRRWLKLPPSISSKEQENIGMTHQSIISYFQQVK
jgi:hypothetical protein